MTDGTQDLAATRAKWRQYFEKQLTDPAEVNAATDAAMDAIGRRAAVDAVIAAGQAAVQRLRATGSAAIPSQPAPPPAAPARPSARPSVGSASSGMVTGFQQRQEMISRTYYTVWNFRLERTDANGQALSPIPVEMKGRYFKGAVSNGDIVDIGQAFRPGKLVQTRRVRNVSVGVDVQAVGRQFRVLRAIFVTIFLIVFFAIFLTIGGVMLNHS